jgi:SAM-dependent methyltransferase
MESTELCEIMGRCGSDKGHKDINNSWHNYTLFYYSLFKNLKYKELRVFEVGLGTNNPNIKSNMCWFTNGGTPGASLLGWEEFFPNSKIFGADIDKDILFSTDRIKTYYCNQTNPDDIKKMWEQEDLLEPFDIIIEDGLHEYHANVCFLENSIHKLKKGGYYIIEDISQSIIPQLEEKVIEWRNTYPEIIFDILRLKHEKNNSDNNILLARRAL